MIRTHIQILFCDVKQYVIFIFDVFDTLNRVFLTCNVGERFWQLYFYENRKETYVCFDQTSCLSISMFKSLLIQGVSIVANMSTESQVINMSYTNSYSRSIVIKFHLSHSVSKIYCLEINSYSKSYIIYLTEKGTL